MNPTVSIFMILAAATIFWIALRATSTLLPAMFEAMGQARMYGLSPALGRRLLVYNVLWTVPTLSFVYFTVRMVLG